MKCNQHKKVESYHNGELHGIELKTFLAHLENCSSCSSDLMELEQYDQVMVQAKAYRPELSNPETFKNEILHGISVRQKPQKTHGLKRIVDGLISILVQPVTRYSFISAAVIIFGVFIYQQTIIVQKIGSLEKRMETNVRGENAQATTTRKNVETFIKNRPGTQAGDLEYNELLQNYRLLLIEHKVLLKVLQEKYPETYEDILKQLEEANLLEENINI